MSKEKALKIIKICEENNIYYTVNTEKYIISKKLKNNLLYYYYENSKKPEKRTTNINIVENVEKYISESNVGEVTKITISDEDASVFKGIIRKLKELNGVNILEVSNMSRKIIKSGTETVEMNYFYTEITKENVSKWQALKRLATYLGIQETEIVAIGDNINDMEMIQNAGLGIIIGESALSAKGLNKITVANNDKNGVSEAIEKYIIQK